MNTHSYFNFSILPVYGFKFDAQLINASSYTIIDMHGKICKAGDLVNNEINIRELKSGVYVVVLKRADGEVVWRGVNVLM